MARKCFYSFHYKPDCQRAAQVRNIGSIEGNRPALDNAWESITRGGDEEIKRWIAEQMKGTSCTIVLVGSNTAKRKWIDYEIIESWNNGKGVVGIHIHGLKNFLGLTSEKGQNPFTHIIYDPHGSNRSLSTIVNCYDPPGYDSKERYRWIQDNILGSVEEAIEIRANY